MSHGKIETKETTVASVLRIIINLFRLEAAAKLETHRQVIVKIHYEFVVRGTLKQRSSLTENRIRPLVFLSSFATQ
jgi:hypothetical protein